MSEPLKTVMEVLGKRIEELEQNLKWAYDGQERSNQQLREMDRHFQTEREAKDRALADAKRLREALTEAKAATTKGVRDGS